MTRYVPPSSKMTTWMYALANERLIPELGDTSEERVAELDRLLANRVYDMHGFSTKLDVWKNAPFAEVSTGLVPGVYRHNGTIYVVKPNRTNPRLHARRLIEIGGRRLTEANTVVQIEFAYDRDALGLLRPRDQMTLEEARPFIIRYGRCIFCNTPLSDAQSVARGVGPVCIKRYAPEPAEPELSSEQVSDLLARLGGGS